MPQITLIAASIISIVCEMWRAARSEMLTPDQRHLAATAGWTPGYREAEVTKVDGRQIEFTGRATEGAKEIGGGSHSRVVIDVAKFTRRLE
jgi:predicted thioesterase